MGTLSPVDRLKFRAILVQFDAAEDGVKLAAACEKPSDDEEVGWRIIVEDCLRSSRFLTDWEAKFCSALRSFPYISKKQRRQFGLIAEKIRSGRR